MGGLLWASAAFTLRIACQFVLAKVRGGRFEAFDRPSRLQSSVFVPTETSDEDEDEDVGAVPITSVAAPAKGRFF